MRERLSWHKIARWAVVLLAVLALKFFYSSASADQLRWILAPTTLLVEFISGTRFDFESYAGYVSQDRSFVIAPACAGVNFLIAAFLMLSLRKLLGGNTKKEGWRFIPVAALIAYLVTLIANTVRIAVALQLRELPEISWLSRSELHRVEGILVYAGFLLTLFLISEKLEARKSTGLLRPLVFPLLVYYATTLGIPLLNGGYRQEAAFWEHSIFVLLIPLLLLLPLAVVHGLWMRVRMPAKPDDRALCQSVN
jgi:exosortase K